MLHGIDVSSYQADFHTGGPDFVFVKTTESRSCANPSPKRQVERAGDAECVVGS